jgi:hypothetical protein
MTYHKIVNNSNMTGASSGRGTAYHFEKPEFIHSFILVFVMLNLVNYVYLTVRFVGVLFVNQCDRFKTVIVWSVENIFTND